MDNLKRITTDYDAQEDRITLAGLPDKGQALILWLTMRLASRLIKHCLSLLEKGHLESKRISSTNKNSKESIQKFVQESAEQQTTYETAVKVSQNSPKHLIVKIDIRSAGNGVTLSFKDQSSSCYELFLDSQQLRQWLGILHTMWQRAEWPTNVWPDWMETDNSQQKISGEISVH